MKTSAVLSVAATLAAITLLGSAASAQVELTYAVESDKGSLQTISGEEFTRRFNERMKGKALVKFFDSAQLGKDKDLMAKLKLGSVHFATPSSIMSSVHPLYGVFDLPFLFKDRAHVARFEKELFPRIAKATDEKGYTVLALFENGYRNITNNVRPINKPEDLKGLKIRIPGGVWRKRMFETWGANATPLAFSELFVALQTKVMDGQENPNSNIHASKFFEVQKFLSVTNHVYSPLFLSTGKEVFAKLDPAIQKAAHEIAAEVAVWARQRGGADDGELEKKLVAGGMQRNVADRAAFVAASKPIYEAFGKEVPGGQELIDGTLKLAN